MMENVKFQIVTQDIDNLQHGGRNGQKSLDVAYVLGEVGDWSVKHQRTSFTKYACGFRLKFPQKNYHLSYAKGLHSL